MQIIRNNKGVSLAVTSVVIMAAALLISMVMAYWTISIIPVYARHEEIRITRCIIESENSATITLKNTGSFDAIIEYVSINSVSPKVELVPPLTLKPGEKTTIDINLNCYSLPCFKPGVRYDFIIYTNNKGKYPTSTRAY
jgi:hypothetical protein